MSPRVVEISANLKSRDHRREQILLAHGAGLYVIAVPPGPCDCHHPKGLCSVECSSAFMMVETPSGLKPILVKRLDVPPGPIRVFASCGVDDESIQPPS